MEPWTLSLSLHGPPTPRESDEIAASLRRHGMIHPPVIWMGPVGEMLVDGLRRVTIASQLGLKIPEPVRLSDEDAPERALAIALDLNPEPFPPTVGRRLALMSHISTLGITGKPRERLLRRVSLTGKDQHCLNLTELLETVEGVVDFAFMRGINIGHLESLLLLPADWRGKFMERVVLRLTLSVKETRRIARLMLCVNERLSLNLDEILAKVEIDALLYESASAAGAKSTVEKRLTDLLDPSLDARRRQIEKVIAGIQKGGLIDLDYDEFLNGRSVRAAFRFSSPEKLMLVIERLASVNDAGDVKRMFDSLRGDETG